MHVVKPIIMFIDIYHVLQDAMSAEVADIIKRTA